jgi:rSAM/selenodomain-associated transferase 2
MPPPRLAAVIPTLNARARLSQTLACLHEAQSAGLLADLVVSDGGSGDGTRDLAMAAGARVVSGPPGRGGQLARGATAASPAADWFLFLHGDTALASGWTAEANTHMRAGPGAAGYFRFALDDVSPAARRLEAMVAWRSRRLGLPYGDQGLLISRSLYDSLGGFRSLPLMEDVDMVRRIGKARLRPLAAAATTSAERFRRDGYWLRSARNLACLGLYFAGAPAAWIKRVYG